MYRDAHGKKLYDVDSDDIACVCNLQRKAG
jgi:hypothetical protein